MALNVQSAPVAVLVSPRPGGPGRLEDPHPVDEHLGGIATRCGVAAAGTTNRKVQDREQVVVRVVEWPFADGSLRSSMPVAGTLKYGSMPSM